MQANRVGYDTTNKRNSTPCTDHTGRHFPSMRAMCEHWGPFYTTYKTRMKRGWTQEEALTGQRKEDGYKHGKTTGKAAE